MPRIFCQSSGLENRILYRHFFRQLNTTRISHAACDCHILFRQAFHVFWRNPKLLDKMMSLMLPEIETPPGATEEEKSRRLAEALFGEGLQQIEEEPVVEIDRSDVIFSGAAKSKRTKDYVSGVFG